MLEIRETLSRDSRISGESWRRNFGLPVVNIDAGESDHELHCGWNPISPKRLERLRMAAQRFFLLPALKQPQNRRLMSDEGTDMGAMMRCKFKSDQRADAAAEYEGRFVSERDNQSSCVVPMRRDVVAFRLNRCAAREAPAVVGNDREIPSKLIRQ